MSKAQDVFGGLPIGIVGKPYLQIHAQFPLNTGGGLISASNEEVRPLNTVITNEVGASLAANVVTMPAGLWFFLIGAQTFRNTGSKLFLRDVIGDAVIIEGLSVFDTDNSASPDSEMFAMEIVLFPVQRDVYLFHICVNSQGDAADMGQSVNRGDLETYTDFQAWKLA